MFSTTQLLADAVASPAAELTGPIRTLSAAANATETADLSTVSVGTM